MNFLNAIRHAAIGYGIRRKTWGDKLILSMDNACCLWWLHTGAECIPLGGELYSLSPDDIKAKDWETV